MTRSPESELSGWEDPRATLFLDQWDSLIEDARYILVYGFPWDVSEAMQWLWIEEFLKHPEYAYRIWDFYNQRVRDFYVKHADRCLLVNMNAVPASLERFVFLLGKLGIGSTDVGLAEVVEAHKPKSIEGQKSWVEMAVVGNLRSRSTEGPLRTRWITVERQDPLIDLSMLAWPDASVADQRERLSDALAEFQLRTRCDVTVVFDGAEIAGVRPLRRRGIRVVFSAADVTECFENIVDDSGNLDLGDWLDTGRKKAGVDRSMSEDPS